MYLLNIIQITIFFFSYCMPSFSKCVCIYVCLFVRASLRFCVLCCCCLVQHTTYNIKKGNWNRKKKVYYICIQWLIVCGICSIEIMIHVSNKILSFSFSFFCFCSKPSSFLLLNGFIFLWFFFVVCCVLLWYCLSSL